MEPSALKAGSKQEDGFGVQPRRVADLGRAPSLRRSSSSLCRSRRAQYPFSSCEKVGFQGPGVSESFWGPGTTEGGIQLGRDSCPGAAAQETPEEREPERTAGASLSFHPTPEWVRDHFLF